MFAKNRCSSAVSIPQLFLPPPNVGHLTQLQDAQAVTFPTSEYEAFLMQEYEARLSAGVSPGYEPLLRGLTRWTTDNSLNSYEIPG